MIRGPEIDLTTNPQERDEVRRWISEAMAQAARLEDKPKPWTCHLCGRVGVRDFRRFDMPGYFIYLCRAAKACVRRQQRQGIEFRGR